MRLRETEWELEGMKEMDESGIYRFLECTEIVRGMLNKRWKQTQRWRLGDWKVWGEKTQGTTSVRERGNRGMNRDRENQLGSWQAICRPSHGQNIKHMLWSWPTFIHTDTQIHLGLPRLSHLTHCNIPSITPPSPKPNSDLLPKQHTSAT